MGQLVMMGSGGHKTLEWDVTKPETVAAAREKVDQFIRIEKGTVYRMLPDGTQGERITSFDEKAERLILVPQMAGGVC